MFSPISSHVTKEKSNLCERFFLTNNKKKYITLFSPPEFCGVLCSDGGSSKSSRKSTKSKSHKNGNKKKTPSIIDEENKENDETSSKTSG